MGLAADLECLVMGLASGLLGVGDGVGVGLGVGDGVGVGLGVGVGVGVGLGVGVGAGVGVGGCSILPWALKNSDPGLVWTTTSPAAADLTPVNWAAPSSTGSPS
jgi:hypothetical protein